MPEGDIPAAWDFRTLLAWWNLYALPALLLAAAVLVFVKNRRSSTNNITGIDIGLDGRRLVKIAALIHLGISVQALVRLTQELLTMGEMGVTESFANFVGQTLSVVINPLLALGFWRSSRATRWAAIGWYALLSVIGVNITVFNFRFHVPVDPIWWADFFAGRLMPFVLLFVMFLPRVRRVFARRKPGQTAGTEPAATEPSPATSPRWSIISIFAVLCLIVVYSNLAVDTADWVERSIAAPNDVPPD